jgi:hypothetical protein
MMMPADVLPRILDRITSNTLRRTSTSTGSRQHAAARVARSCPGVTSAPTPPSSSPTKPSPKSKPTAPRRPSRRSSSVSDGLHGEAGGGGAATPFHPPRSPLSLSLLICHAVVVCRRHAADHSTAAVVPMFTAPQIWPTSPCTRRRKLPRNTSTCSMSRCRARSTSSGAPSLGWSTAWCGSSFDPRVVS